MKSMAMKAVVAVAVVGLSAVVCVAGGKAKEPITRTFVGTSGIYTNGNEPVAISAAFLTSTTNANLAIVVENVSGYDNTLVAEASATNLTSFIDGGAPVVLWAGGLLKFTGSSETNKFTIYPKSIE